MNKRSKIAIIGSNFIIGKNIYNTLKEQDYKNLYKINVHSKNKNLKNTINNFINKNKPNYIFVNVGDYGGIKKNLTYPADLMIDNLICSSIVLSSSIRPFIKKLIYFSSSCIYPKISKQPLKTNYLLSSNLENTNLHYAISKISGTYLCDAINKQYNKNFITLIPSNYFGPHDDYSKDNSHLISALILKFHQAKIKNKSHVKLWGSGKPIRDFTYIDDVVYASILIMQKNLKNKIINISSGNLFSVKQIANIIKNIVGFKGNIIFDNSISDGMKIKTLDNSEIKKIGYKFKRNFEKDLLHTYEWFKRNI